MDIFKLVGSIFVDNEAANKSLDKTSDKASGVGDKLGHIGKVAGTAAIAVAGMATAAVGAMWKQAESTASAADEIDKMSQKLGLSRDAYQEWDYVLSQAGVDISSMETGMKTLTNKLDDAKHGSKSAAEMFNVLGLSLEDLQGMSREDVFANVITGFQRMEDSTERAALANDLFGKSGQNLTALFNSSIEDTAQLKTNFHELGMAMSDDAINSGVEFTDTLDTMKRSLTALVNQLGSKLMPIATKLMDYIIASMPKIQAVFDKLSPVVEKMFETLLPPLEDLAEALLPVLFDALDMIMPLFTQICEAILPVIAELIEMLLPPIMNIIEMVLPALSEIIQALLPLFNTIIELLMPIIQLFLDLAMPIIDLVVKAITPLITVIAELLNELLKPIIPVIQDLAKMINDTLQPVFEQLKPVIDTIIEVVGALLMSIGELISGALEPVMAVVKVVASVLTNVLGGAFESLMPIVNNIMNVFNGLINFIAGVFTGNWKQAFQGLSDIVKNIFDGLVGIVKVPLNYIIDAVNGFINGLNKIQIPDWVPGVGGVGLDIPNIPRLAKGGTIVSEGEAIVGEAGAELIEMPQGARVTPLTQNQKNIFDNSDVLEKMDQMIKVMQGLATDMANKIGTVNAVVDGQNMFDVMVKMNQNYTDMTGNSAFI